MIQTISVRHPNQIPASLTDTTNLVVMMEHPQETPNEKKTKYHDYYHETQLPKRPREDQDTEKDNDNNKDNKDTPPQDQEASVRLDKDKTFFKTHSHKEEGTPSSSLSLSSSSSASSCSNDDDKTEEDDHDDDKACSTISSSSLLLPYPQPDDVLFGRGNVRWPGNQKFQAVVKQHVTRYHAQETKAHKTRIVWDIVAHVKGWGGRFLAPTRPSAPRQPTIVPTTKPKPKQDAAEEAEEDRPTKRAKVEQPQPQQHRRQAWKLATQFQMRKKVGQAIRYQMLLEEQEKPHVPPKRQQRSPFCPLLPYPPLVTTTTTTSSSGAAASLAFVPQQDNHNNNNNNNTWYSHLLQPPPQEPQQPCPILPLHLPLAMLSDGNTLSLSSSQPEGPNDHSTTYLPSTCPTTSTTTTANACGNHHTHKDTNHPVEPPQPQKQPPQQPEQEEEEEDDDGLDVSLLLELMDLEPDLWQETSLQHPLVSNHEIWAALECWNLVLPRSSSETNHNHNHNNNTINPDKDETRTTTTSTGIPPSCMGPSEPVVCPNIPPPSLSTPAVMQPTAASTIHTDQDEWVDLLRALAEDAGTTTEEPTGTLTAATTTAPASHATTAQAALAVQQAPPQASLLPANHQDSSSSTSLDCDDETVWSALLWEP